MPPTVLALGAFMLVASFASAANQLCEPAPEVKTAIDAASAARAENATFEERTAPFRALRDRFTADLFAHLRYQDAVAEFGIEGHLRQMEDEYLGLKNEHPSDLFYMYLFGRALEGRSTPQAISLMNEILAATPDFAPAHRTLAEIYGSEAFRNRRLEAAERAKFLDACPQSHIARRPPPIAPRSKLLSEAEKLAGAKNSRADVPALVGAALEQDEWRLQRIRPFDWYSTKLKKQLTREMRAEYWRAWRILVHHYRKTGELERAEQLLAEMRGRLTHFQRDDDPKMFRLGVVTVLDLYSQANQLEEVRKTLAELDAALERSRDRTRSAELAKIRAKYLPKIRHGERLSEEMQEHPGR